VINIQFPRPYYYGLCYHCKIAQRVFFLYSSRHQIYRVNMVLTNTLNSRNIHTWWQLDLPWREAYVQQWTSFGWNDDGLTNIVIIIGNTVLGSSSINSHLYISHYISIFNNPHYSKRCYTAIASAKEKECHRLENKCHLKLIDVMRWLDLANITPSLNHHILITIIIHVT
jgi:hypothetical protein